VRLTADDGTVYEAEPDGSFWSDSSDRSGVFYEDDDRPADAEPLYRLRVANDRQRLRREIASTADATGLRRLAIEALNGWEDASSGVER
jgi:hypothetical protein